MVAKKTRIPFSKRLGDIVYDTVMHRFPFLVELDLDGLEGITDFKMASAKVEPLYDSRETGYVRLYFDARASKLWYPGVAEKLLEQEVIDKRNYIPGEVDERGTKNENEHFQLIFPIENVEMNLRFFNPRYRRK